MGRHFVQKGSSYPFVAGDTHKVILSGNRNQDVSFENSGSKFNVLEAKNYTKDGIVFKSSLSAVKFIDNGCNISFSDAGKVGWKLTENQAYDGDLYLSGGVLDLNGYSLIVKGRLIQSGGTVFINGGHLLVEDDYRIQTEKSGTAGKTYELSNGYLKMTNSKDRVEVEGSFITQSQYSHDGYLTEGVMDIKGH